MKLGRPIFKLVGAKDNKRFVLEFDVANILDRNNALNLIGASWLDVKYGIVKDHVLKCCDLVIATDSDLLAHDDYIAKLQPSQTILLINKKSNLSASSRRLRAAQEKLKTKGINCRYFGSEKTAMQYIAKLNKRGAK